MHKQTNLEKPKNHLLRNILFSAAVGLTVTVTWICVGLLSNPDAFVVEDAVMEDFRLCTQDGETLELPAEGLPRMETIELFVCGELIASKEAWIALYWLLPGNEEWTQAAMEEIYQPGSFQQVVYPLTAEGFPVGTYPIEARQNDIPLADLEMTIRE